MTKAAKIHNTLGGMDMNYLNNNSLLLSEKVLDFLWQKQVVSSNNIANAETPGFQASYVTFEDELKSKIAATKNKTASEIRNGILSTKAQVHLTEDESTRADGNNVNLDVESMEIAKAALQYQYMLKSFSDDAVRLGTVIRGQ